MNQLCLTYEEIGSSFIDSRNTDLWNTLLSKYTIGVLDNYSSYRLDYVSDEEPVAITVSNPHKIGLFTHELLHLNLRKEGLNTFCFFESLEINNNREFIIPCAYTLCNTMEHILFFDDFIDMGFNAEEFVSDYISSIHTKDEFELFTGMYNNVSTRKGSILYYYALMFTLLSEKYMGLSRNVELNKALKLDRSLYYRCMDFYEFILDFDLSASEKQIIFNDILGKHIKL